MINKTAFYLASCALFLLPNAAFAQAAEPVENVTVVAPFIIIAKRPPGIQHVPVMEISASQSVSYSDLDLRKADDAAKLKSRISDAAGSLCSRLKNAYPSPRYMPVTTDKECVKSAQDQAIAIADRIISASGG